MLSLEERSARVNMGGFLESRYAELRCRLCKSTFCCKNCRRKHEATVHLVHPDCHICIYGKISISLTQASSELLQHIKEKHWPLHCVRCRKVYQSLDNIGEHNFRCPGMLEESTKSEDTPPRLEIEQNQYHQQADFLSPDMEPVNSAEMTTSTPMVPNHAAIQVPDNITPVDSDRLQQTEETARTESSSCKRVTFFTTPAVENNKKKRKKPEDFLKTCLRNSMRMSGSASTTGSYRSVTESLPTYSHSTSVIEEPVAIPRPAAKRLSQSLGDTLWTSAINNTLDLELDHVGDAPVQSISHHISFEEKSAEDGYTVQDAGTSYDTAPPEVGVWASMTSMFKNVVKSFHTSKVPVLPNSLKRNRSVTDADKDVEERILKRHKLCDVRCRPTIRPLWKRLVPKEDKSIQTDF